MNNQEETPLKPCPFCGSNDVVEVGRDGLLGRGSSMFRYRCGDCESGTACFGDPKIARLIWNSRESESTILGPSVLTVLYKPWRI